MGKEYWQHNLRVVKGRLQERVEVSGYYDDGSDKRPEYIWKDVPDTIESDDCFREEE